MREGQTLLVPGAAGGVGGYLVELAAQRGLHVIAVTSALDAAQLRSWGATTFIRRSDDLAASVRGVFPDGVHAAIDAVPMPGQVLPAVRDGGTYVTLTPYAPPQSQRGITVLTQIVHQERDRLARLAGLVDEGRLTLRVAATFPLTKARAAHELFAKGGHRGRIVLIP